MRGVMVALLFAVTGCASTPQTAPCVAREAVRQGCELADRVLERRCEGAQ